MSAPQKNPLRPLTDTEKNELLRVSRSLTDEASRVAHAKELLAVVEGKSYAQAAQMAGRHSYHAVSVLVKKFNETGLAALTPGHGGGRQKQYSAEDRERILKELKRQPERDKDGTASWSIETLKEALHRAEDGLPEVGHRLIWEVLRQSGYSWQRDRSWCHSGSALRRRKEGVVEVVDEDADAKKKSHREGIHKS